MASPKTITRRPRAKQERSTPPRQANQRRERSKDWSSQHMTASAGRRQNNKEKPSQHYNWIDKGINTPHFRKNKMPIKEINQGKTRAMEALAATKQEHLSARNAICFFLRFWYQAEHGGIGAHDSKWKSFHRHHGINLSRQQVRQIQHYW